MAIEARIENLSTDFIQGAERCFTVKSSSLEDHPGKGRGQTLQVQETEQSRLGERRGNPQGEALQAVAGGYSVGQKTLGRRRTQL